jgi:16S rRNA (guanine527-N7)-methyltransferase
LTTLNNREFRDRFARRARRAGVSLSVELIDRFEIYYRLLSNWNTRINLTGLNLAEASPEALDRLLIEPLVAARYVPASAARMLDIGSGGGSPAIPLVLTVPRLRLVMVESKTRKSVFLREAIRALELPTAEVATARFEELLARPDLHEASDLVTIRAVRLEARTLMTLQAFIKPGGLAFLFRSSMTPDPPGTPTPPLFWKATYPLLESLRSRLVVMEKRPVGPGVPRGRR